MPFLTLRRPVICDFDEIASALTILYKKQGATVRAIRQQPVLMQLPYVVAQAARLTGEEEPSPVTVATECRKCIIDAIGTLPGGQEAPYDRDNHAVAAAILLGVAPGTAGSSRRFRRQFVLDTIEDLSETVLTHKRDEDPSYETRVIENVAQAITVIQGEYEKQQRGESHPFWREY